MKTAGWSTRRVAGQVDRSGVPLEIVGSSGHEKVPTRGKPDLQRPGRPRGERIEGSTFSEWSPRGQFSSKIMLARIQQELLKTSYVIFRLFHGRSPDFVPWCTRVGSAKTTDAIVSLCT
ncbi:hypothetical protein TNCV_1220151 [Trichonephila clavipes]|nr:hypothetical protein TNCV_1220151 [Trichonephila clavipes]